MQNTLKKTCLLCFWVICYLPVFSQDHSGDFITTTRYYTPNDGLASREVFCAIQDNDGFMWFGTRNGLNRYDGKNFKLFTKQLNGLADNKIIQLAKDNHHHLFIVYGNPGYARSAMRIEVMDLRTYQIRSLKETFPQIPFSEDYVYWIANGGDDLCFLVANPFRYWRLTSKGFELMCEMKKWDEPVSNDQIWLTVNGAYHTTMGPYCQFYDNCALLKLSETLPQYFCANKKSGVITVSSGTLISPQKQPTSNWTDVNRMLNSSKPEEKKVGPADTSYHNRLIYFLSGNFANALIYTDKDGLFLYDFTSLDKLLAPGELNISTGNGLYSYFIDRQNNFWICTAGGLIKIVREKNLFSYYFTKKQLKDSSENQVRGIYADEANNVYGAVWSKFYHDDGHQNKFSQVEPYRIIYGVCRCMNKIYVGEMNVHLFESGKKEALKKLTSGNTKEIWSLDSLAPYKLLVGSTDAIFTFDINTNELKTPVYSPDLITKAQFVYRFIRRNDKKIWAVAQNGLYLLNENADTVTDYFGRSSKDPSHRLPFDLLHDAYEDENGIFWFATNGQGLFRWNRNKNPDEQEFKQFTSADGLPSGILYRIESDDDHNLWISTDNGLVRFNTKNFKTRTYTHADGISHDEFNRASSFRAKDGRLFFGGLNGVNAFYPNDFRGDTAEFNMPLQLVSFNQFIGKQDKLVDQTNELIQQNAITLHPADKFFTLEFQLLDFEEAKHRYAYMIEGLDKDWNYISENSIRLSGLPYGSFKLRVRGQNAEGEWSKNELAIPLSVLKPFYRMGWFYFAAVICLIALIYLFMYWRTRTLEKANARLEEIVGNRTLQLQDSLNQKEVLLKEIHHRVKNNLQIISSMLELQAANAESDSLKKALVEGQTRVSSIALIHHRLYENDSLGHVEFSGFLKDLYKQVAAVFQKDGHKVDVIYDVPETYFDIDTIVPLGLIVNELFTNSFKYAFGNGRAGTIGMSMTNMQKGAYILTYKDNGRGLPAQFDIQKASSLGLRLIYRLGKQLGGMVAYNKQQNTFTITFKDAATRKQHE